jgi:hypothetical protein
MYKFTCLKCEFKTNDKGNYDKHLTTKLHSNNLICNTLTCDVCGYIATRRFNLTKHIKIHQRPIKKENNVYNVNLPIDNDKINLDRTYIKQFKCNVCHYTSSRKSNLIRHNATHLKHPGDTIKNCTICKYETTDIGNFSKHLKTHELTTKKRHLEMCKLNGRLRKLNSELSSKIQNKVDVLIKIEETKNALEKLGTYVIKDTEKSNVIKKEKQHIISHIKDLKIDTTKLISIINREFECNLCENHIKSIEENKLLLQNFKHDNENITEIHFNYDKFEKQTKISLYGLFDGQFDEYETTLVTL